MVWRLAVRYDIYIYIYIYIYCIYVVMRQRVIVRNKYDLLSCINDLT
jgi:hypothetical protein